MNTSSHGALPSGPVLRSPVARPVNARTFLGLPLVLVFTLALAPTLGYAADPGGPVDFARDIYPILQRSCFECHGPEKQSGKLRLDSRPAALRGGRIGPALVPGQAQRSELYRRITLSKGDDGVMPARGERLAPAQADLLRRWIDQGALWPPKLLPVRHWAYVKPVRPPLPPLSDTRWPRNPIDHFILARLEKEELHPSGEADRAVLLRRVSLDLIGLPPTPAEIDAFLADPAPDAYQKVVDRLLASPQFGPRWARPWLDLARYADSHGFQRDDLRPLWPYRDWVINSVNQDMPYDRFTIEQLAGNLLPDATEAQRIATGFHRSAPTNVEAGSDPEETRVNQIIDRVNTTAAVWLGATLECAQCHDHKYDPFTQKEYYQLFAYFNSTAIEADRANPKTPGSIRFLGPIMPLRGDGKAAERMRMTAQVQQLDRQLEAHRKDLLAALDASEAGRTTRAAKNARRKQLLDRDPMTVLLRQKRAQAEQSLRALAPAATLVMQELPRPRMTAVFGRGDFRARRRRDGRDARRAAPGGFGAAESTDAGALAGGSQQPAGGARPREPSVGGAVRPGHRQHRGGLWRQGRAADASRTARLAGRGVHGRRLVRETVAAQDRRIRDLQAVRAADAGAGGTRRSEPAVRSWAALPHGRRDDPRQRPRRRRPAEPAAGWAAHPAVPARRPVDQGGRGQGRVPRQSRRRALPARRLRGLEARLAVPELRQLRRHGSPGLHGQASRSNTPLQALTLLNDPVYVECAAALAQRLLSESGDESDAGRVRHAFRLCLAREPHDTEVRVLRQLLDRQRTTSAANAEAVKTLLGTFKKLNRAFALPKGCAPREFTAWYAVATVLLNLDETITKG